MAFAEVCSVVKGSSNDKDYYVILGVDPRADSKTIRKAYLKQSLKYHPDKNVDDPESAKQKFVQIGEAYEVLSDPAQRAGYDRYQRSGVGAGVGAGVGGSSSGTGNSHRQDAEDGYYYGGPSSTSASSSSSPYAEASSSASFQYQQDQKYRSYREAFDATMAGLSESELRDVMGAAALLGSIVGGIAGSRLLSSSSASSGGGGQAFVRTIGAVIGSHVASRAATALVSTAHQQSTQRAALDQERRERVARGEPGLDREEEDGGFSVAQAWKDLAEETVRQFQKGLAKPRNDRNVW